MKGNRIALPVHYKLWTCLKALVTQDPHTYTFLLFAVFTHEFFINMGQQSKKNSML